MLFFDGRTKSISLMVVIPGFSIGKWKRAIHFHGENFLVPSPAPSYSHIFLHFPIVFQMVRILPFPFPCPRTYGEP